MQDLEFKKWSYKDRTIAWNDHSVPLRSRDTTAEEAYYYILELKSVEESTNLIKKILDAEYYAARLLHFQFLRTQQKD